MRAVSAGWEEKIERAEDLSSKNHSSADILRFYAKILRLQQSVQDRLNSGANDVTHLAQFVPELLQLLTRYGTNEMKELAEASADLDWNVELSAAWNDRLQREYTPLTFLTQALLQPFAQNLAANSKFEVAIAPQCPCCQCPPHLGVLRPEGDGGKKYLLCSFCGTEWEYRRIICPHCAESDKEKLPTYKNDENPLIKLAACDTCHTYLKCIDLGIDGHAVPAVDDLASLPMSLWITEKGFHPIRQNLFGF